MIERIRFIWQLLVLASALALLGMVLVPKLHTELGTGIFLVTLSSVCVVNLITYLIIYTGIQRNNKEGVVFVLGGIGIKFLLYLLFLLLIWMSTKNLTKAFIVTFFALYLMFTFFTAGHLLKLLKNK
jgi:hypothetical protein